jgi:hypothetical protein
MLRCPTCLSLLLDPDVKRCPACRSKIRRRSRPAVVVEHSGIADRPRPLVERELQARIEAKTAASYRQRRRAAKAARRIASLPPTVLDGDAILTHTATQTSTPRPTEAAPIIIDLPAEAVHDVAPAPVVEPGVIEIVEPEVIEIVEPVVVEPEVLEPVVVEPAPDVEPDVVEIVEPDVVEIVEPVVVEPEVVEPAVAEPEVVEPAPIAAASWQRSSSVWTDRVFNTSPRLRSNEIVEWPPRWKPAASVVDIADESNDEIDYAAPAD